MSLTTNTQDLLKSQHDQMNELKKMYHIFFELKNEKSRLAMMHSVLLLEVQQLDVLQPEVLQSDILQPKVLQPEVCTTCSQTSTITQQAYFTISTASSTKYTKFGYACKGTGVSVNSSRHMGFFVFILNATEMISV